MLRECVVVVVCGGHNPLFFVRQVPAYESVWGMSIRDSVTRITYIFLDLGCAGGLARV